MVTKTLLVTRPKYDQTTSYISTWAKKVIDVAKTKNYRILDLVGDKAESVQVKSMLKKHGPLLAFLNGHGDDVTVTGQDGKIILEIGDNSSVVTGSIIYALSCRSARILGLEVVKQGALAYIGYVEDFIFMYTEEHSARPLEDETAALFLEPSNQVVVSLLKGNTAKISHINAKKFYLRNIQKLLTSKSSAEDTSAVRYLLWDLKNLVCHGDGNII